MSIPIGSLVWHRTGIEAELDCGYHVTVPLRGGWISGAYGKAYVSTEGNRHKPEAKRESYVFPNRSFKLIASLPGIATPQPL